MASYGTVFIDGIQLDLDPEDYKVLGGRRFGSEHPLVDGTIEYQDFGFDITHAKINLTGTLINYTTLTALATLYASATAVQMPFTDWRGNALTVIFTPGQDSFDVSVMRGATSAWTFTMNLSIVAATVWNGINNPV